MKLTKLVAAAVLVLCGCSRPPDRPDLYRVLGHTPEEVRDYLGAPKKAAPDWPHPDTKQYEFKADGLEVVLLVKYLDGKAALAVPVSMATWTESEYRAWVGENCAMEVTTPMGPNHLHVALRPPCTPRIYK